ncbi:hypothetical protein [[Clostridium] scindens]|uniref:hypothetical protein n=1 Tax=Clostridium scindens (strain JCM 10418 / VPI 12708) TaxID=29347 RepID=UPI00248E1AC0|nr:hypothetical protein [[Clostridium] scindens]
MYEVISAKDIKDNYGLNLTENDIKEKFPYERGTIENLYEYEGLTVTYNPYHAMQYKNENYPCIVWGKKYKGKETFIFHRKRKVLVEGF